MSNIKNDFEKALKKEELKIQQQKDAMAYDFNQLAKMALSKEEINEDSDIYGELLKLLALPEEQFMIIAPSILSSLEQSINNTTDKLLLVQAMNASGTNVDELRESLIAIQDELFNRNNIAISNRKKDFISQLILIIYNAIASTEGIAKRIITIPIELCDENAKMPTYAHDTDAGMDLYALEDITINPGETKLIRTGLKMAIPKGFEIQIRPKSGRTIKSKLRIPNSPGTIDSGFRDELQVIIENVDPPIRKIETEPVIDNKGRLMHYIVKNIEYGQSYTIGKGEKFAQAILSEVPKAAFHIVEDINIIEGDRGGGFGSTGLK